MKQVFTNMGFFSFVKWHTLSSEKMVFIAPTFWWLKGEGGGVCIWFSMSYDHKRVYTDVSHPISPLVFNLFRVALQHLLFQLVLQESGSLSSMSDTLEAVGISAGLSKVLFPHIWPCYLCPRSLPYNIVVGSPSVRSPRIHILTASTWSLFLKKKPLYPKSLLPNSCMDFFNLWIYFYFHTFVWAFERCVESQLWKFLGEAETGCGHEGQGETGERGRPLPTSGWQVG